MNNLRDIAFKLTLNHGLITKNEDSYFNPSITLLRIFL